MGPLFGARSWRSIQQVAVRYDNVSNKYPNTSLLSKQIKYWKSKKRRLDHFKASKLSVRNEKSVIYTNADDAWVYLYWLLLLRIVLVTSNNSEAELFFGNDEFRASVHLVIFFRTCWNNISFASTIVHQSSLTKTFSRNSVRIGDARFDVIGRWSGA